MATRAEVRLVVRRVEGVLVRVLGAVVRRGFEPVRVTAAPGRDADTFDVALVVEGARPVAVLSRHLANLYDVHRLEARDVDA